MDIEEKDNANEGSNINKSLLALTNCINILSEKKRQSGTFIPYRNSKLTRLLKEPLGGNKPIVMVVCLSTNAAYIEETLNSIKYANKARKITKQSNSISQDKLSTKEEFYKKRVFELEQECRHLKNVLKAKEHSKSRDNIKTMISYTQIEENTKNENLKDKFKDEERQFSELLEFLIENVEDVNVTK